jgi:phosphatidylserine decarboxylase
VTKDGYGIVFGSIIITIILFILSFYIGISGFTVPAYVALGFSLFCLQFFRDPDAVDTSKDHQMIASAQGTVIQIKDLDHNDFIGGPAIQVSIFLNVFNIHVNSHPFNGVVKSFEWRQGKMLVASNVKASEENEQTIIGLESKYGRFVYKQITGLIARRIIARVKEGDTVQKGVRYGMMRFGSRMDFILPKTFKLAVKVGDKVERGETVLGEFFA